MGRRRKSVVLFLKDQDGLCSLRRRAAPKATSPVPNRSIVVGSGTGALTVAEKPAPGPTPKLPPTAKKQAPLKLPVYTSGNATLEKSEGTVNPKRVIKLVE